MSRAHYPLWYGLARGVELRSDGHPAFEITREGWHIPYGVQLAGLALPMLVGLSCVALHWQLATGQLVPQNDWFSLMTSAAGIAFIKSGIAEFLLPAGVLLIAGGLAVAVRTRLLRRLGQADRFTKAFTFLYLAPGVTAILLTGAMAAVFVGLMLLYVAVFVIALLLFVLGAVASGSS